MSVDNYDTNRHLNIYVAEKPFGADDVIATSMLTLLFERHSIIYTTKKPSADSSVQSIWIHAPYVVGHDGVAFHTAGSEYMDVDDECRREFAGVRMSVCGQIWKAFGRLLLQKHGACDEDYYVFKSIYREFIQPVDLMAKSPITLPGSLIYVLNSFNPIGDEMTNLFRDAVLASSALVERMIVAHIMRGNLYTEELSTLELAFTDRQNEAILVLPVRCQAVHLFLKDYDPQQEVKFIVQPRHAEHNTWQVWAVDYKRRRFQVDVPLLSHAEVSAFNRDLKIRTIHPGRYLAVTCNLDSAVELARLSLLSYQSNYLARLKRWWFDV